MYISEYIRHRANGSVRQWRNALLRLAMQNDNTEMAVIARVILKMNPARGVFPCGPIVSDMMRVWFQRNLCVIDAVEALAYKREYEVCG